MEGITLLIYILLIVIQCVISAFSMLLKRYNAIFAIIEGVLLSIYVLTLLYFGIGFEFILIGLVIILIVGLISYLIRRKMNYEL